MESTFTQRWIRKFRILTLSLIFSGALNIGLLATFIAFLMQDRQESLSYPQPHAAEPLEAPTNVRLLSAYARLSFRELCSLLTNTDFAEEGYRKRDLALTALSAFHHFNIEKALGGVPGQRRVLKWEGEGGSRTLELYPGLTDDQFQAVIRFAYLEKWPLTGQGLFSILKKSPSPRDLALDQAFAVTPEFYALQTLFQKSGAAVEQSDLIDLVAEGTWPMLEGFLREQSQMLDLSDDRRRRLLLSYLAVQSPAAARLLLLADFSFALKRLDDKGIYDLLAQSQKVSEPLQKFCVELLKSSRSDAIWAKSAELLYKSAGEESPQPFERGVALDRFAPGQTAPAPTPVAVAPVQQIREARRTHAVKEGENLWKIARQYKVKLDDLVSLNGLEKNQIKPGMVLQIPQ